MRENIAIEAKKNKYPFKYTDLFLIPVLVILIILTVIFSTRPTGSKVVIIREGKVIGEYNLTEDKIIPVGEVVVNGEKKSQLKVVINNQTVKVVDSTCPDHLCEIGTIKRSNSMIVCLPNKIIIKIEGKTKDYDYISG